jgi:hypothetical protein
MSGQRFPSSFLSCPSFSIFLSFMLSFLRDVAWISLVAQQDGRRA